MSIVSNENGETHSTRQSVQKHTIRLVLTAMFIGLSLVLKMFSIQVPLFGFDGMRVGITGIVTAFPAILFGPIYGGITSALVDLLGWVIKPTGDFNIFLNLTAFIAGFIRGGVWWLIKRYVRKNKENEQKIRGTRSFLRAAAAGVMVGLLITSIIFTVGVTKTQIDTTSLKLPDPEVEYTDDEYENFTNKATVYVDGKIEKGEILEENRDSEITKKVSSLIKTSNANYEKQNIIQRVENSEYSSAKTLVKLAERFNGTSFKKNLITFVDLFTVALRIASIAGIVLVIADLIVEKILKKSKKSFNGGILFRVLVALLIAGIIETTINTEILIKYYGISVSFVVYWIPRLIEEIIVVSVQSYAVAIIYNGLAASGLKLDGKRLSDI